MDYAAFDRAKYLEIQIFLVFLRSYLFKNNMQKIFPQNKTKKNFKNKIMPLKRGNNSFFYCRQMGEWNNTIPYHCIRVRMFHRTGILMNNEMDDFLLNHIQMYIDRIKANKIEPKKRLCLLWFVIVFKEDKPLVTGSPGSTIITAVLQELLNHLDLICLYQNHQRK